MLINLLIGVDVLSCKDYHRRYDLLPSLSVSYMVKCLYTQQLNIQIGTFFGCISDSVQPLTVRSHRLLCVQPNYSWKHNTAKSCTEYSQFICSVVVIMQKWMENFEIVDYDWLLSWFWVSHLFQILGTPNPIFVLHFRKTCKYVIQMIQKKLQQDVWRSTKTVAWYNLIRSLLDIPYALTWY